jgi:hypothetical protein
VDFTCQAIVASALLSARAIIRPGQNSFRQMRNGHNRAANSLLNVLDIEAATMSLKHSAILPVSKTSDYLSPSRQRIHL